MNQHNRTIRAICINIRCILKSTNFLISIAICFAILFVEVVQSIFANIDYDHEGMGSAYFYNISIHFGYYVYAAPLICSFATCWLFCDDLEAGMFRLKLLQSGRIGYCSGLWFGTTLCGGLALFTGTLVFALTCVLLFPSYIPAANIAVLDAWIPIVEGTMSNWAYMLVNSLLAFLFGIVWSGVGLAISIWSQNRYVSYFSPFIVCFCSILVMPSAFQPTEMLVQMNWVDFTFTKLLMYQGVLYVVIMMLYCYSFERKIIHGKG